jgi:hypothetical protein
MPIQLFDYLNHHLDNYKDIKTNVNTRNKIKLQFITKLQQQNLKTHAMSLNDTQPNILYHLMSLQIN